MGSFCTGCGCRIRTNKHTSGGQTLKTATRCRECLFWAEPEGETAAKIEAEVRSGTICHCCFAPLFPPGGTTIHSWDGDRILRVCYPCKKVFEEED